MCSSGNPFLCCGKSNRLRCVPFTPLSQSSPVGCCAASRCPVAAPAVSAAAAPMNRPRNVRRCVLSLMAISSPSCANAASLTSATLHVFLDRLRSDFSAVDVAGGIDRDAFCRTGARRVLLGIGNEVLHLQIAGAADTHAAL